MPTSYRPERTIFTLITVASMIAASGCVVSSSDDGAGPGSDDGAGPGGPTAGSANCTNPTMLEAQNLKNGGTLNAGCYQANQLLEITGGQLVLKPGVTIKFARGTGIIVRTGASLTARGSNNEEGSITLTGIEQKRGFWKGLYYVESDSDSNVLRNVTIAYAGGGRWTGSERSKAAVYVGTAGTDVSIQGSRLVQNANSALKIFNADAEVDIMGNVFRNNEVPIWIYTNQLGAIRADNQFTNNDKSYVKVGHNSTLHSNVEEQATWSNIGIPYRFERSDVDATIAVLKPLTIAPGVTLQFEQDQGLLVEGDGRLIADANNGPKITFTGTDKIQGFWAGIYFKNSFSSDNVMNNVVLEYGGSRKRTGDSEDRANLQLGPYDSKSRVVLKNSVIRGSGKYGVQTDGESVVASCTNVTFENNADMNTRHQPAEAPISTCQ